MYSIIYLALALLFMNTKASIKNKLQVTIVLSIMLITQFLVFNSIDFDNLEIMLYISLLLINPICSIILGILIVKETNLIWTLIGLPIIPLSIYFLLFNESFHWYGEIHQIVIIYSIIYLILGLLVTIINKFIKVKKIKWLISILLVAIIMIPTFIITINKEAIRDLKYYIKEWYDVDKGIITDYDNKKITIQNEYYEEYSTSYRDFNTNHNKNNLDINKINVGDKVIIDIISSGKKYIESVVTKKDDERQTIAFNSLFLIIDDLYKKDIRLITDDSGNKIKFNEVELNQKVKILSKRKSLMAYL